MDTSQSSRCVSWNWDSWSTSCVLVFFYQARIKEFLHSLSRGLSTSFNVQVRRSLSFRKHYWCAVWKILCLWEQHVLLMMRDDVIPHRRYFTKASQLFFLNCLRLIFCRSVLHECATSLCISSSWTYNGRSNTCFWLSRIICPCTESPMKHWSSSRVSHYDLHFSLSLCVCPTRVLNDRIVPWLLQHQSLLINKYVIEDELIPSTFPCKKWRLTFDASDQYSNSNVTASFLSDGSHRQLVASPIERWESPMDCLLTSLKKLESILFSDVKGLALIHILWL